MQAQQQYSRQGITAPGGLTTKDKTIWGNYFEHTNEYSVREQFKLNRPDVGWYQIRNALKARDANGSTTPVKWVKFETAYEALGDELRPQVYHFGFLKA
ncbi:hypothetical protein [Epibacterium ulvae]|uniref:hypothetical protein n=1 Tax=Epibacterium ulvae TaxID=1156985 RepID=UPI0024918076|nr:hypothetical protein [Epibacterium ulvae]